MKKLTYLILILFASLSCKNTNESDNLQVEIDSLTNRNQKLLRVINEKDNLINYWYDAEYDGINLIKLGISNPKEYIENSLRQKPELIPIRGELGGKMNFGNIEILSSKWLIAEFDDGHIHGKGIYEYNLNKNGELDFKLLSSMITE